MTSYCPWLLVPASGVCLVVVCIRCRPVHEMVLNLPLLPQLCQMMQDRSSLTPCCIAVLLHPGMTVFYYVLYTV